MIEVTKTIYLFPDGTKKVEKISFYVQNSEALEAKRVRDSRNLGCESIRYVWYEMSKGGIE